MEGREGGRRGSGEGGVKRAVACDRKACIPAREAVRLGKPRKVRRRGRKGSGDCKQLRDRKRGQAGITKGCGGCKVLRDRKRGMLCNLVAAVSAEERERLWEL